jgi:hypothetical protein
MGLLFHNLTVIKADAIRFVEDILLIRLLLLKPKIKYIRQATSHLSNQN